MTDPISSLLTVIRNGNQVRHEKVGVPYSSIKWAIVNVLKEEGFIVGCQIVPVEGKKEGKRIEVTLKYASRRENVITGLRRRSKPGRRLYTPVDGLNRYRKGFSTTILSTPKGVMTDKKALREKVGGEVLCTVW